jgi:hypothetical protein
MFPLKFARIGRGHSSRPGRFGLAAALVPALVVGLAVVTAPSASAVGGGSVGPVDPAIGYPTFFGDATGLKMAPCLDGLPLCTATAADLVAPGGEVFYSLAKATAGPFDLTLATEGAFLNGLPDAFQRTRFYTPKVGSLQAGATYTVTEPYGTHTVTADAGGSVLRKDSTTDLGCLGPPCGDFLTALNGPFTGSSFLTWDTYTGAAGVGAPPAGYAGDNATPHKVKGSPTGNNFFQVDGPNIGGPGVNTIRTDLFTVLGKVVKGPAVGIDPPSLTFGNVPVGTPVTKTVTLTSKGADPLFVGGTDPLATATPPTIAGPNLTQYAVSAAPGADTCTGTSVAPGATCTIAVTYTPAAGASSATLTILTNAGPQDVALSGQSLPAATVTPASTSTAPVSFGSVVVGATSASKTVTLTNTGGAPMTLTGVSIAPNPNDFAVSPSSTCTAGAVIAPAGSCTAVLTFAPASPVLSTATLSFNDDAASSPQDVFLSGTGIQPAVSMSTPAPFPNMNVGATSAAQTVIITNSGTAPLHINAVNVGTPALNPGDFPQSDNCFGATTLFTLGAGASCQATVSFAPTAAGSRKALLQVTDDAPGSPHSVALSGLGVAAAPTAPTAPTVGTATAGNTTAIVTWTAPTSTGGSAITGYTIAAVNAAGTVVATAAAGAAATNGTVTGLTNGTTYNLKVAATNGVGTGVYSGLSNPVVPVAPPAPPAPKVTLSPTSVVFAGTAVGASSAAATVTLTNSGTATLNLTSVAVGGTNAADFVKGTSTCGTTLAAGASCTTPVTFRPTLAGARSGTLVVTDNAAGSPHTVALTGSGGTVSVPTVTAKNPASGATGVAIGSTTARTAMTVTFSEAVTGLPTTAAATANFTLKQGTTAVASTVVYNTTTHVATLTPAAPLLADKPYTLALTSTIKSASGGALAAQTWNFLTGPRPTVTGTNPATGATGIGLGTTTTRTPLTATFSEAVTGLPTLGAATANFTLKQGTTAVASKVVYNATTRVATLTPDAPLIADRTYTLTLTTGIKDVAGNPITAKTWTFITGPRPTVATRTPASGAVGVGRTANITATFSETVTGIPTTAAAAGTFTIKQTSTGTAFASVASYNTTTRVATLNPTGTLLANTQYTVTLTSGIKDTAGNTLTTTSWTFTTGAA